MLKNRYAGKNNRQASSGQTWLLVVTQRERETERERSFLPSEDRAGRPAQSSCVLVVEEHLRVRRAHPGVLLWGQWLQSETCSSIGASVCNLESVSVQWDAFFQNSLCPGRPLFVQLPSRSPSGACSEDASVRPQMSLFPFCGFTSSGPLERGHYVSTLERRTVCLSPPTQLSVPVSLCHGES